MPHARNTSAIPRPIPLLAPVTIATRPLRSGGSQTSGFSAVTSTSLSWTRPASAVCWPPLHARSAGRSSGCSGVDAPCLGVVHRPPAFGTHGPGEGRLALDALDVQVAELG